jgi:hypothetical protein
MQVKAMINYVCAGQRDASFFFFCHPYGLIQTFKTVNFPVKQRLKGRIPVFSDAYIRLSQRGNRLCALLSV